MVLDFEPHTEDLRDDHLGARDSLGDMDGDEEEKGMLWCDVRRARRARRGRRLRYSDIS
jgi:hypothetical protein